MRCDSEFYGCDKYFQTKCKQINIEEQKNAKQCSEDEKNNQLNSQFIEKENSHEHRNM